MENRLFRFSDGGAERKIVPPRRSRGSLADALARFAGNRLSVTAAVIIGALLLFALITPALSHYDVRDRDGYYRSLPPIFARNTRISGGQAEYDYYAAADALRSVTEQTENAQTGERRYSLDIDSYARVGYVYVDVGAAEFAALQAYQNATGEQVCYPLPRNYTTFYVTVKSGANLWYKLKDESAYSTGESAYHDENGAPVLVANYLSAAQSDYHSLRLPDDPGDWVYGAKNQTGYRCRVRYSAYYRYRNGFSPTYLLGSNQHGQDILTCLASGARLSFALSIGVALINLAIGLCYGALEGYYGGKIDLILERVADILSAIPFIVVATLFQLHLRERVGAIVSLLFAFVLTGWIGIGARVRTQFYRFKGAEYVLYAHTQGARDRRIIWRHILPNAVGTIVTSAVVLIPSVIFGESMLSYLGIVDLESANLTSIGTMLANGRAYLGTYPHILLFPAVFLALLEISFNLLGNGLRDAFNPLLKSSD